ncbi:MAG: zinc ABC transporter substrate-binding protein [Proteobacteria bacterium]|nr:zinc ABC transporter substrate-binding protein [Pseudomonadota bacterium]
MRKLLVLLCVFIAGFAASAKAGPMPKPMQVAVGVAPVEYFARKIGGQLIQTVVLVPAGADAHTYEPKPSQMRELSRAGLYLSAGLEFETAWEPRLKAANPGLLVVRTDQGLARMPMPGGHDDHHDDRHKAARDHEAEMDPHVWVSAANVRHMAARIAEAFAKADPTHAKVYTANLAAFQKEIDAVDAELRSAFAGIPADKRGFLVFHPAWGYLARDYGLTQAAIEFEGKEPSPRRLGALIAQAKTTGVKVIFVQPQMSRRTAESIAQALGARVLVVDPLAADWAANLRAVAGVFRSALR